MAARPHRADEDARVEEVVGEPDPVAEQRALRERARRVDRDDADRLLVAADVADERADQARLADPGRPGDADRVRAPRLRVELADELVGERVGVLDERDRARERPPVAAAHALDQRLARPLARGHGRNLERGRTGGFALGRRLGRPGGPRAPRAKERDERRDAGRAPPGPRPQRGPTASVSGPATTCRPPSTTKFELISSGEHAPAQLVGSAALDEQRVADDRDAVAEPTTQQHRGDPDVRSDGRGESAATSADRGRHRPPRAPRMLQQHRRRGGCRARGRRRRPRGARSRSRRVERLLGEHDLRDVDARGRQHDDVPGQRTMRSAARAPDDRSPRPGRASGRGRPPSADCKQPGRDPDRSARRRRTDGIDPVRGSGPVAATRAPPTSGRPPRRGSRSSGSARSRSAGRGRRRGSAGPRRAPGGRSPLRSPRPRRARRSPRRSSRTAAQRRSQRAGDRSRSSAGGAAAGRRAGRRQADHDGGRKSAIRAPTQTRVGPVVDVDRQCDEASQVPNADARREREQAKARISGADRRSAFSSEKRDRAVRKCMQVVSVAARVSHAAERLAEEGVLLGRSDRDPNRARARRTRRSAERSRLPQQLLEERPGVLADLGEDEVRDRRADRVEARAPAAPPRSAAGPRR